MNSSTRHIEPPAAPKPSALRRDLRLPFNPWWVLWVLGLASPWLLPTHLIPWRGFHADLLMVLALLPAAFWAQLAHRERVPVPPLVMAALAVACIPPIQLAGGVILFAGDAWIAAAYLLGFALAAATGARFEQVSPGTLVNALFASFGLASLLSIGVVLYQWLGLTGLTVSGFELLTLHYPGPRAGYRPFGNVGQSNHLATLLVWGLIGLWWAYLSGRVRAGIGVAAAAFLLLGVVATQTRTAWIQLVVLVLAAVVWRRPLEARRCAPGLMGLSAFMVLLTLGWEATNRAFFFDSPRALAAAVSSPGLRPAAWSLFLDAVAQRPWTGWGWNQVPVAHSAVAMEHPALGYTFQSAHNFALDMLVQNGLPLGLLIVFGLAGWLLVKARRVDSPASCLLLLAIVVLSVHALLEFPQTYAYFLLPAGLMMGALETVHPWGAPARINRWIPALMLSLSTALTAWIAVEYNMAERNLERLRFERARVGPSRNSQPPDLILLTQLRDFLRALRLSPKEGMSEEEIELMRRVAQQYPSSGNQLMLAHLAALNGKPELARTSLARMCRMVPAQRCRDAAVAWRDMAKSSSVLATIEVPRP